MASGLLDLELRLQLLDLVLNIASLGLPMRPTKMLAANCAEPAGFEPTFMGFIDAADWIEIKEGN